MYLSWADVHVVRHVIQRPAIHRAGETPLHAGAVRIDVLGVELVGPGRFLIVLRAHRAEHARRLVEERRAAFLQRVLDHRGVEELDGDVAVAELVRTGGGEIGVASLDEHRLQIERAHLRAGAAAGVDRFRAGHDAGAEDEVLAGGRDRREAVVLSFDTEIRRDLRAEVDVVEADERRGIDELRLVPFEVQQRPLRRFAVEHEVIDAVEFHERREVVAGVRIQQHARFRRPRGHVAARCRRHQRRQNPRTENQRNLGIDRLERLIEQVVQQEHVHAASAEERGHDAVRNPGAADFLTLQVDEDRLALRRELLLGSEPWEKRVDARSNGHSGLVD